MARQNTSERITMSLRLSPLAHSLVVEEAKEQGISINQFISEVVVAHAAWARGQRGEPIEPGLAKLLEEALKRSTPTLYDKDPRPKPGV